VIAGEQEIGLPERKRHMVGGVAGRRHRLDGPTRPSDDIAIGKRAVGPELGIVACIHARGLADVERSRGTVRAFGQHQGPGRRLDWRHCGGVVAMGVGDENMRDRFPPHGVEERSNVGLVERTGIDDGDLPSTDDIGDGPLEREWPGVVGEQPPHARHDLLHRFGGKLEAAIKRDVGAHAKNSRPRVRRPRLHADARSADRQPSLRPMMSSQRTSPASSPR
jgi:hypothetical protein